MDSTADTFPRLLAMHARERPDAPATREKDLGIWQTWSWSAVAAEVRAIACGLAAEGFTRGMHLAIIGDNRPRLYWAMIAAEALGGVPVPMYQDAPAAEFAYVLNDAEIVYALALATDQAAGRAGARHRLRLDARAERRVEPAGPCALVEQAGERHPQLSAWRHRFAQPTLKFRPGRGVRLRAVRIARRRCAA